MIRRVLLLGSVVALIVVMVAMSVGPAFAAGWNSAGCKGDDLLFRTGGNDPARIDKNGDTYLCVHENPQGHRHAYDNRYPITS
jgi:hypothetical protein